MARFPPKIDTYRRVTGIAEGTGEFLIVTLDNGTTVEVPVTETPQPTVGGYLVRYRWTNTSTSIRCFLTEQVAEAIVIPED